jgi:starch synthase
MRWALNTALDLFADRPAWLQMMRNGMARDFSWEQQGREYVQLYTQLTQAV